MRKFDTGATRDTEEGKLDYRGFLSPYALKAFAEYMHKHRTLPDGSLRASDDWKKGMPLEVYVSSAFRHFMAVWERHERGEILLANDDLCALMFNVQGILDAINKPLPVDAPKFNNFPAMYHRIDKETGEPV